MIDKIQSGVKKRKLPIGVRASGAAIALLQAKLALTSGNIVFRGDSNTAPFTGAEQTNYINILPFEIDRALSSANIFPNANSPYNVVVIPFAPDTAAANVTDSPQFDSARIQTYGMVKVIGPESPENYVIGSPVQSWIQPRTPGVDNATAGAGYCSEVRVWGRAGDSSARHELKNCSKFSICFELRRSGTVSQPAGNQPGYDDSNASIAGGVTYASNVNQAESINVTGETTASTTPGAAPAGVYFNGGNVDVAFTGGGQDQVGAVWTQWFDGINPGNKDFCIRIKVPTGYSIRLFCIAFATANAKGQNRSNVEATTPRWSLWNFGRSGAAMRHYSPTYDASGGVTAAQKYRRWFGAVVSMFGVPKVDGAALSGATSVPVLYSAGVDIIIDQNMVNDYTSQLSTVANIKAYVKNAADAANALGIPFVKILPPCSSNGETSTAAKNAYATNYALIQTAMRELVNECQNFILVDSWEALGNPLPVNQFQDWKVHPGFTINNQPAYSFDGQHFSQTWRDMVTAQVVSAFKYAKTY